MADGYSLKKLNTDDQWQSILLHESLVFFLYRTRVVYHIKTGKINNNHFCLAWTQKPTVYSTRIINGSNRRTNTKKAICKFVRVTNASISFHCLATDLNTFKHKLDMHFLCHLRYSELLLPPPRRLCFRRCLSVCLFVCLFVSNFAQKLPNGFARKF